MRKHIIYIAMALFAASAMPLAAQNSEDDYDESIRMPIRRLHPEREREKARKKLQQELDAKNKRQQTSDDAWEDNNQPKPKKDNRRVMGKSALPQSTADKSVINELLSKDYSLVEYLPAAPQPMRWKDDPIRETENELLMQVSKSSPQSGTMRYMPRDVSMSRTENAFYAYFTTSGGQVEPLHLRVQYYADDPLQFNDILFQIDGFDYRYRATSPRRGKGTGRMIWEESDQVAVAANKDLLYALSHAHWVRMSLVGADGTKHVKMLTEKQIRDFYSILQLYRLLGGEID